MPKARSLKDQVCDFIREKISSGEWMTGQKISEQEICDALEISRTPVREALIKLASEHQIEWIDRKGFQVKEFSDSEKKDQYIIASVLDVLAAVLAIPHLEKNDYKKMKEAIENGRTAIKEQNYIGYVASSEEFHRCYYKKCNNQALVTLIDSLRHNFFLPAYHDKDKVKLFATLAKLNDQHEKMIALFQEKDAQKLEDYIRQVHWKTRYVTES